MNPTVLMQCGHAANSVCSMAGGQVYDPPVPACAICGCLTKMTGVAPNLLGRLAVCLGHRPGRRIDVADGSLDGRTPSKLTLPFFEYRPTEANDVECSSLL